MQNRIPLIAALFYITHRKTDLFDIYLSYPSKITIILALVAWKRQKNPSSIITSV